MHPILGRRLKSVSKTVVYGTKASTLRITLLPKARGYRRGKCEQVHRHAGATPLNMEVLLLIVSWEARMTMTRTGMLAAGVAAVLAAQPWEEALAACNATVNGRPMSPELCALATRVYGQETGGAWAHSMPRATCCATSIGAAKPGPIAVLAAQPEAMANAPISIFLIPAHPS